MTQSDTPGAPLPLLQEHRELRFSPVRRSGDLYFLAGQIGVDEAGEVIRDAAQQYAAAFEQVTSALAQLGAAFTDVVDMTTYHTTFEDFELFNLVKARYITSVPYPAWTAVQVSGLVLPGALAEVKCTAQIVRQIAG